MKKIFFSLSIIVILSVVYLIVLNNTNIVAINYIRSYVVTMDPEKPFVSYSIKLSFYTLAILLAGIFSGAGIMSLFLGVQSDKVKDTIIFVVADHGLINVENIHLSDYPHLEEMLERIRNYNV